MMKQIFNKAGAGVLTAVIATAMAGFGGPTGANAQTATSTRETPNPFCSTVLPRLTTKMQERFTEQVKRLNERQGNRTNKAVEIGKNRNAKLNDSRAKQDAFRNAQYEKLRSLAKNDAQKQAVEKFITTVNEALNFRRGNIGAADFNYSLAVASNYKERRD